MTPDTASRILKAMMNERRPGRTRAARVMDSLAHVRTSDKKKAGYGAGLEKDFYNDEQSNLTLPDAPSHPPRL